MISHPETDTGPSRAVPGASTLRRRLTPRTAIRPARVVTPPVLVRNRLRVPAR